MAVVATLVCGSEIRWIVVSAITVDMMDQEPRATAAINLAPRAFRVGKLVTEVARIRAITVGHKKQLAITSLIAEK